MNRVEYDCQSRLRPKYREASGIRSPMVYSKGNCILYTVLYIHIYYVGYTYIIYMCLCVYKIFEGKYIDKILIKYEISQKIDNYTEVTFFP